MIITHRWYKEETYLVVVNMRDMAYMVDLTYLENVDGDASVVVRSVQSPKDEG